MTASALNQDALQHIADGKLVLASELLKQQLALLLDRFDTVSQAEQARSIRTPEDVDALIGEWTDELSGLLAVTFPLIEYGGEAGQEAAVTAIGEVGRQTARAEAQPALHETFRALTARLAWVTGAFALCCDDPEFLTRLTRVAMPSPYERHRVVSVIDEPPARYLQAYGGSAGTAFDAHEAWLGQLEFVPERYPLVARDGRLLDALKEVFSP